MKISKQKIKKIYKYLYKLYCLNNGKIENNKGYRNYSKENSKLCFDVRHYNWSDEDYFRYELVDCDLNRFNIWRQDDSHRVVDIEILIKRDFSKIKFTKVKAETEEDIINFFDKLDDMLKEFEPKNEKLIKILLNKSK